MNLPNTYAKLEIKLSREDGVSEFGFALDNPRTVWAIQALCEEIHREGFEPELFAHDVLPDEIDEDPEQDIEIEEELKIARQELEGWAGCADAGAMVFGHRNLMSDEIDEDPTQDWQREEVTLGALNRAANALQEREHVVLSQLRKAASEVEEALAFVRQP